MQTRRDRGGHLGKDPFKKETAPLGLGNGRNMALEYTLGGVD